VDDAAGGRGRGSRAGGGNTAEEMGRFIACTTPEIYRTLVVERASSPQKFEEWSGDLLVHQLPEHR
jgi:hypothetical protein